MYFLLDHYWAHLKFIQQFNAVCPDATGGSPTIHTITAFITALGLTGVAMLFYWSW